MKLNRRLYRENVEGADGFMLLAVVVMTALVLIGLSVAAPIIAREIRREKELETEHRAKQYVRAIRLYYRRFGTYPPSINALEESNNVRFLRKQYVDPLTGTIDWRLIHFGQQKTTIKGFFGRPLGAPPTVGLGAAAGMVSDIVATTNSTSSAGIGSAPVPSGTGGTNGTTTGTQTEGSGDSVISTSGNGAGSSVNVVDAAMGGFIVGVGIPRSGESILEPNGQKTYETWEFWYDPRAEDLIH